MLVTKSCHTSHGSDPSSNCAHLLLLGFHAWRTGKRGLNSGTTAFPYFNARQYTQLCGMTRSMLFIHAARVIAFVIIFISLRYRFASVLPSAAAFFHHSRAFT